jgi:hypothetical protein
MQLSFGGFVIEEVQVEMEWREKSEKGFNFASVDVVERNGGVGTAVDDQWTAGGENGER